MTLRDKFPTLGGHIGGSLKVLENFRVLHEDLNFGVYQVFLHSPLTLNFRVSDRSALQVLKKLSQETNASFVAHGPYLTSLARGDLIAKASVKNCIESMELCESLGIKHFVIHVGSRKSLPKEEALKYLYDNVVYIRGKAPQSVCFCLETGHGSSQDTDMGSLRYLSGVLSKYLEDNEGDVSCFKNMGLCYDTQHLFADGITLSPGEWAFEVARVVLKMVHLNGNEKTIFGKHSDRHSYMSLRDSAKYNYPFENFKDLFVMACDKNLPIILERRDHDVMKADVRFLDHQVDRSKHG